MPTKPKNNKNRRNTTDGAPMKPADEEISTVLALQAKMEELQKHVVKLEQRLEEVESKAEITSRINDALVKEIDRLEQYERRHSVVIRGVAHDANETIEQLYGKVKKVVSNQLQLGEDFEKDFDKTHRIGPVFKTNEGGERQDIIVRFKSHSSRYKVYNNRKKINKERSKIRIAPSLTNFRRKLLKNARDAYEQEDHVDCIFCDQHGDLKIKFKNNVDGKLYHTFCNSDEISKLVFPEEETADEV